MSNGSSSSGQSPYTGHFADNYFWGNTLGEGGNSTVKLVYNPFTEQRMACKIFEATEAAMVGASPEDRERHRQDRLRQVRKEYMMLKMVEVSQHENVCKFLGVRQVGETYFMFFELLTGGELFNHIVPDVGIPASRAKMYFVQICSAIAHLQSLGMAHRDIKGENCLLTDDLRTLKVTDFGWATIYKNQGVVRTLVGAAGTEPYMCPEMHAKDRPYRAEPVDYWSAGVVLIAMLTGEMPWDRAHVSEPHFVAWVQGNNHHMPFDRLTAEQLTFLRRLLCLRPSKRLIGEAVMQHPWIRSRDLPEPTRARGVAPRCSSSQAPMTGGLPASAFVSADSGHGDSVTDAAASALSAASPASPAWSATVDLPPPEPMIGGFTQPARLGGFTQPEPLGCTQPTAAAAAAAAAASELTASQLDSASDPEQIRLHRLLLPLTRFFAAADAATTRAELLKALGAVPELRATQMGQGTIHVTTTLPGTYPLAFKICLYLVRSRHILVEFRRTSGSGLRFNQFYARLRALLGHIVSRDVELDGLLAAAAAAAAATNAAAAAAAASASAAVTENQQAAGLATMMMDCTTDDRADSGATSSDDVTMH